MCNAADDPEREELHVESLLKKRVDGIVVTARRVDRRRALDDRLVRISPCSTSSRRPTTRTPSACCPTTRAERSIAVEHLVRLGRRRIAHVTGPERFQAVRDRRDGYRNVARTTRAGRAGGLLSPRRLVGRVGQGGGRPALPLEPRAARRDFLRQRPDRARRDRRAARAGHRRSRPGFDRRLRQLGHHGRSVPAAAHQRRHEPEGARPRGRPPADRPDRRRRSSAACGASRARSCCANSCGAQEPCGAATTTGGI